ncbi:MAG: hypothetical protein KDA84_01695 [Planctomycetaceae bacterium]|nr:hypothetical protein [Planctomycetaceae bacterium]
MSKTRSLFTVLSLAVALTALTTTAQAADREVVAYRLTNWKTVHFDDAKRADTHAQTIKRLGCEVKTGDHGGHIDVSYRCTEWREISLDSHSQAHRWEDWLKASGFETRHSH